MSKKDVKTESQALKVSNKVYPVFVSKPMRDSAKQRVIIKRGGLVKPLKQVG